METIYVFTCGCELKKEDVTMKDGTSYRCPEHKNGRLKHFMKKCLDCPAIIKPKHYKVTRCEACQKKAKLEQWRIGNAKRKKLNKKDTEQLKKDKQAIVDAKEVMRLQKKAAKRQAVIDSWDCSFRDECFKKYNYKMIIPCLNCERYTPISSHKLMKYSVRSTLIHKNDSKNR